MIRKRYGVKNKNYNRQILFLKNVRDISSEKKQLRPGRLFHVRAGNIKTNVVSTSYDAYIPINIDYKENQEQEQGLHDVMSKTCELDANHVIL